MTTHVLTRRSWVSAALMFYAGRIPYHRGKQKLMEHAVALAGVSMAGETIVRRRGLRWSLDPSDYVCKDLFWCGAKDVAQLARALDVMRPDGVMFDLGASFGYYSIMVASALKQCCTVHAFEPFPAAFDRLCTNLRLNEVRCVHAHPLGVSDGLGSASVVAVSGNSGAARLIPGGSIPVVALDEFCRERDVRRLDLMKVDVEGSEVRVLRGARHTLDTLRPAMLLEVNGPALQAAGASIDELWELLATHRYRLEGIRSRRPITRDDLHATHRIIDVFCRPL